MPELDVQDHALQTRAPRGLATLDAMALLARQLGSVVHVVVAREPGVVEHARASARRVGVGISIDLLPSTIRVRLDGSPT